MNTPLIAGLGTTIVSVSIIIVCAIASGVYIHFCKKNSTLTSKRRWIEQLPSLISTLGVLGTFFGITLGLMEFDPNDLNQSIPELLEGLKTAFFTSLAGMIGSLILSRQISSYYDKEDDGVSDINIAAGEIVKAVKEMSDTNRETLQEIKAQSIRQANDQNAFYGTSLSILQSYQSILESLNSNVSSISIQSQYHSTTLTDIQGHIEHIKTGISNIESLKDSLNEILNGITNVTSTATAIEGHVNKFSGLIHTEVEDIKEKMSDTNTMLTKKFDEFTELLKKSNTEALVEVMKSVTEEFQKQMNSLINKLIQENFEQLNQSVQQLNTWQVENKEMISSLTSQYKEMADNFETTSDTLSEVSNHARSLVGDSGKLQELVNTLNEVIIEDEHFITITSNLTEAVSLTKENMQQFDESTRSLNEWIKKQRNFVDGVALLIEKLEDLNKLRDYNEQFWKDTKRSLEEGVGFISQGTRTLNTQLTNLDRQFYARLSATLAELDTCIQAMINKR